MYLLSVWSGLSILLIRHSVREGGSQFVFPKVGQSCRIFSFPMILFSLWKRALIRWAWLRNFGPVREASGQKVSLAKSRMFCSGNVSTHFAKELSGMFGIQVTQNLGKYLGVSLLRDRVRRNNYRSSLKFRIGCRGRFSLAGRFLQLSWVIQRFDYFVLSAMIWKGWR